MTTQKGDILTTEIPGPDFSGVTVPQNVDQPTEQEVSESARPGQQWLAGDQEIDWSQICYVRSLKFEPKVITTEDGAKELIIPTAATATDGKILRATSHWTVNHPVTPHMAGGSAVEDEAGKERSWEHPKYFVLCPGESTNKLNGKPYNLFSVDTYWKKDMALPANAVVLNFTDQSLGVPGLREVMVDLSRNMSPYDMVQAAISGLGYSPVVGQDMYVNDSGFDEAIFALAEAEGLQHTPHTYSNEGKVDAPEFTTRHSSDRVKKELDQGDFGSFFDSLRGFQVLSRPEMRPERAILLPAIGDFLREYYQSFSQSDIDVFSMELSYLPEDMVEEVLKGENDSDLVAWYEQRKAEAEKIYQERLSTQQELI